MKADESTIRAIQQKRATGLSYAGVAALAGIPPGTLSNALNGYMVSRRVENRIRVALGLAPLPSKDPRKTLKVREETFKRFRASKPQDCTDDEYLGSLLREEELCQGTTPYLGCR